MGGWGSAKLEAPQGRCGEEKGLLLVFVVEDGSWSEMLLRVATPTKVS